LPIMVKKKEKKKKDKKKPKKKKPSERYLFGCNILCICFSFLGAALQGNQAAIQRQKSQLKKLKEGLLSRLV